MSPTKFFIFSCLSLLFLACGEGTNPAKLLGIRIEGNKKVFKRNELVNVQIDNKNELEIKNVTFRIDDQILPQENNQIKLAINKLGNKLLQASVELDGETVELSKKIRVLADVSPELYSYEIINEFPHDIEAFTQGLEFENDVLYESTGRPGKSSLRRTNFETGEVLIQVNLDYNYFGEGITVLGDKIYQLTWQNKMGFIYDTKSLKRLDSFQYGESKEGWGLCNDGERLFKSDGTERIWILDPETLVETDYIEIVTDKSVFNKANELEYVDGKIYANVWQKESMMIIDASTGIIEGVVNFGGLKQKVKQHPELDVLNGIAYHPRRGTFFVTGKNWDKLFEVRIYKK